MDSCTQGESTKNSSNSNEFQTSVKEMGNKASLHKSETAELQLSAEKRNSDAKDSDYDFNESDVKESAESQQSADNEHYFNPDNSCNLEHEIDIENNGDPTVAKSSASFPTASAEDCRPKKTCTQPSCEATSLSLRAEKESLPSKRRLLSDMYKIMANDELPFTIKQKDEDRMDQWIIKLNKFDVESDLYKDLMVLGLDCVELHMIFPEDYPFVPPFVHVSRPRFARGTGFVIDGALCMELLEPRGWSPANSVETVIISIQSHLVIGKGRLHAVVQMGDRKKNQLLQKIKEDKEGNHGGDKKNEVDANPGKKRRGLRLLRKKPKDLSIKAGAYTVAEAKRSFQNILSIHKKEGWSKHWVKKG